MSDKTLMRLLEQATREVKAEELDSAITTLKEILTEDPDHEIALGMLASLYLHIGLIPSAIELFEKLLASNPENPLARFQMGLAELSSGNPEQALTIWEPMLTLENEFMAHFHSALAHIELGHAQEALNLLENAAKNMPVAHPLYPQMVDLHKKLNGSVGTS